MEVRKRWFVNGEPAPMTDYHGKYLIPAMNLLNESLGANLPQRQQFIAEPNPELIRDQIVGFPPLNFEQYAQMVNGAMIRIKADPPEVWVDLSVTRTYIAKEFIPEEGEEEDYLFVGVRLSDGWGQNWWWYDPEAIVLVQEPDNADGSPRQEVGTHLSWSRRPSTPKQWTAWDSVGGTWISWDNLPPVGDFTTSPVTLMTDNGLCFTSTSWWVNIGERAVGDDYYTDVDPSTYWWIRGGDENWWEHWVVDAPFDPLFSNDRSTWPPLQTCVGQPGWCVGGEIQPRWDSVAWLDTKGDIDTPDKHIAEFLKVPDGMKELGVTAKAVPGKYAVMVGIVDGFCRSSSDPWYPNEIVVDIRVGRGAQQVRKRFMVVAYDPALFDRACITYGTPANPDPGPNQCPNWYGVNPKFKNWWQGAFLVDVKNKSIEASPYYFPTNGSFEHDSMTNWWCDSTGNQIRISFVGIWYPWSDFWWPNYNLWFPDFFASWALVLTLSGYSFFDADLEQDQVAYPIACPDWCFGGSEMDPVLADVVDYVRTHSFEVEKLYMFWIDFSLKESGDPYFGFVETSIDPTALDTEIVSLPDPGNYESASSGTQSTAMTNLAMAQMQTMGINGNYQNFAWGCPAHGQYLMFTDRPEADQYTADGCYDTVQTFSMLQPAVEIPIPEGE